MFYICDYSTSATNIEDIRNRVEGYFGLIIATTGVELVRDIVLLHQYNADVGISINPILVVVTKDGSISHENDW